MNYEAVSEFVGTIEHELSNIKKDVADLDSMKALDRIVFIRCMLDQLEKEITPSEALRKKYPER